MEESFALAIVFDFTESSIGEQRFCCREQQESRFEVAHGKGFGDAEFSWAELVLSLFFFWRSSSTNIFFLSERQRQRHTLNCKTSPVIRACRMKLILLTRDSATDVPGTPQDSQIARP